MISEKDAKRLARRARARRWIEGICFCGMVTWFVYAVLATVVPSWQIPAGCVPVVCRSGTISGGHTLVWIANWGVGIGAGVYLMGGFRQVYRWLFVSDVLYPGKFTVGFVIGFLIAASFEALWNIAGTVVWTSGISQFLHDYTTVFQFEIFVVVMSALIWLSPNVRRYLSFKRYLVGLSLWFLSLSLWVSIGFPVTLFNGQTPFFLELKTNLIEVVSHVQYAAVVAACVRRPGVA